MIIKLIDAIADWLRHSLGAEWQLRLGVICCLLALPLMAYGFFANEPFLVYQMSAAAIFVGGLGFIVGAEVLVETEKTEKQVSQCPKCGIKIPPPS